MNQFQNESVIEYSSDRHEAGLIERLGHRRQLRDDVTAVATLTASIAARSRWHLSSECECGIWSVVLAL